jgi:hypothetical protein
MILGSEQGVPFRKTVVGRGWELAAQKYRRLRRELYQRLVCREAGAKRILLIVGCQRSGTTLLGNVLSGDLRTAVLQEQSCITGHQTLRLKPYAEANRILHSLRAPFIVAKPLVETQWTPEMLTQIEGSRAVWMYRNYRDVVRSNVKRFHSQIEGLQSALFGQPPSWRSERISADTREILLNFFRTDMKREDAAALGWYARNILYFELGLNLRDDVMLCKYEDFVSQPEEVIARLYRFIDLAPPSRSIANEVDSQSLGLGCEVELESSIRELCDDLQSRLNECYCDQKGATAVGDLQGIA